MKIGLKIKHSLLLILIVIGALLLQAPSKVSAATQIQVKVCPVASSPLSVTPKDNSKTTAGRVAIIGSAKPGVSIKITNNGHSYKSVLVPLFSSFGTTVPLKLGQNKLVITASNACGQSRSVAISIYRTRPSPLSRAILDVTWIILLLILIIFMLWLLLYKRRHKQEDQQANKTNTSQQ